MVRPPSPPAGVPRRDSGPLLVAAGVVVVLALDGPSLDDQVRVLIPLAAVLGGLALLLRELAAERRAPWLGTLDAPPRHGPDLRTLIGVLAVAGALVRLLNNGAALAEETSAVVAALALFAGAVLIAMPYLLRVIRELAAERAERVRAQQFAEVAAHMHDSVLHTLALIQRADPAEARGLARAQERELRAWLYDRRGRVVDAQPTSLVAAIQAIAAEVEDRHRVRIEVVAVGDAELDAGLAACVAAAREALVNAAKYAGDGPISVFAEVEAGTRRVEVFVRDRGPGFELDLVGADRMGIRESIVGRMARHGGRAEVRTAPGAGTEVRLEMPGG
ncbi:sensor histidine kinase [Catenulispora pinisilvae]|uniref:sensor histidine kinase n=1 Tax=Catenulispora pinisilvae TaxID=2705253 RepID=UPI001E2BC2BA|nr:ATP-binding protein [Catenulispora pinisilvae]